MTKNTSTVRSARARAAWARRRAGEIPYPARKVKTPVAEREHQVFAVRCAGGYTWQIRQFGGLVLRQGDEVYGDVESARTAGTAELEG